MRALLLFFFSIWFTGFGQEITHRLIMFGDAGEINSGQKRSLEKAVDLILPSRTSVYFLGDNIYPYGMSLDSVERRKTIEILESQYVPFIQKQTSVTFIAGNHDWDKSGKLGLEKLKSQEDYIQRINNANVKFAPPAGTSDITINRISSSTQVIMFDSEYWLFPHHANPDSALSADNRNKFLNGIKSELEKHPNDTFFILSHHPMRSFGEHGKNFTWKDHIFPLTRLMKNLYIPLPVFGSIYPILRTKVIHSAEDYTHPLYKNLVEDITEVTNNYPNVFFVAGHDHGLQMIQDGNFKQVVTGSGAKRSFIAKHSTQKFASNKQGFCTIDCLSDGNFSITFYTYNDDQINDSYEIIIPKL